MATSLRARDARRQLGMAALALGALGVVFGDIGTSPLYALQTVFSADHGAVKPTEQDVFGVISLVFWSITLIVSIEFVLFIMRADNDGEGGILALIAKVETTKLTSKQAKMALIAIGMFGVALFYGDGMITPAISVLSAVEGVKVVEPSIHAMVVPVTIAIIVVVFSIQRFGTHRIGRVFGPVMLVLVRRHRRRRARPRRRPPGHRQGAAAELRGRVLRPPLRRRLHLPRRDRADDHRRRGPLRRHGPLRPAADQPRLVLRRLPGADPQLHGPGLADRR